MQSIRTSIEQWAKGTDVEKTVKEMKRKLVAAPLIRSFLEEHPNIPEEAIDRGLVKLFDFQKERQQCLQCKGLEHCANMMKGYRPELVYVHGAVDLHYYPCEWKLEEEERKRQQRLVKSLYVPKEILEATFETLDQDEERAEASRIAFSFALETKPGENGHGLYFYGKFGVGKTYMMGAIMNALKERDIDSLIVYAPEFFREMRQSIGEGTFHEKLDLVKKAKVLIIDDIGAETMTSWVRDEVLGVILQYRMLEKLPTLFTSNYDYDELEEHLAHNEKGVIEELKAKRIMERIRHYTTLVKVEGKNRRKR